MLTEDFVKEMAEKVTYCFCHMTNEVDEDDARAYINNKGPVYINGIFTGSSPVCPFA